MGTPKQMGAPARVRDSAGKMIIVGIVCFTGGLIAGYYGNYFLGNPIGSPELPVATSNPTPTQAPPMDPATFLASESALKSTLNSNPKDLNALIELGNLYYDNGKFGQAVESYGKALDIDPTNVGVRTDRGSCYWSLGQADAAIAEFQKSLQVDPSHPQTLFNLGIVYLHGKSDVAGARMAWEKLLATNPNYPQRDRLREMLNSLGATSAASGQPDKNKAGSSNMEDLFKRMKK
jgi:cytochrome c-type biogenesis protein CcmH/NrfG